MKHLRKRFIFFNILVISCIMLIFAILIGFSENSTLTANRMILAAFVSLVLVFIGSCLLSKIALSPIKTAWQKQLDFTANASHELRTPLTTIQANLDVVMHNPTSTVENQMKWLKNIEVENKRMSALVSDLLFLSRADTDEIIFEKTDFDLSMLIIETLATYDATIKQNGLFLKTLIEDHIFFYGDMSRIKQLFIILLDNAIKYNKENGSLDISLCVHGNDVNIKISDTGSGIDASEMNKIFSRFYRGGASRQKNPDGSGLGLAIAKMIAEEHGGTILVESQIHKWSEFTVCLPIS